MEVDVLANPFFAAQIALLNVLDDNDFRVLVQPKVSKFSLL